MDLALNNPQRFICHKTQTTKQNKQIIFYRKVKTSLVTIFFLMLRHDLNTTTYNVQKTKKNKNILDQLYLKKNYFDLYSFSNLFPSEGVTTGEHLPSGGTPTQSAGLRIHWIFNAEEWEPLQKWASRVWYKTELWGVWRTYLLSLLPGLLWPGVVELYESHVWVK